MSKTIAIIGVGLIGGSLGLALKRAQYPARIIGCSRHGDTITRAQKIGSIDAGFTTPEEAVHGADIILLCSPLSSYGEVAQRIVPAMKPGAILTDAGSVKHQPSLDVLAHLSPAQKPFFVPGHPIAGTEKSGPEAAFASLYDGKRMILTPFEFTQPEATATITQLWEKAGAFVDTLGSETHDAMYADISHNVQLLSFIYGARLFKARTNLVRLADAEEVAFQRSTRLCGSNYTMWHDIFWANQPNVLAKNSACLARVAELLHQFREGGYEAIRERLEHASEQRKRTFAKNLLFMESEITNPSDLALAYALPMTIATAIMEGTMQENYAYAVGSGFRDAVASLVMAPYGAAMFQDRARVLKVLEDFLRTAHKTADAITQKDEAYLARVIRGANQAYGVLHRR